MNGFLMNEGANIQTTPEKTKPLCVRQICLFFIAFLPITKLFTLPSVLAETAGRDLWISALVLLFTDLFTAFAVTLAMKKENADFSALCKRYFGTAGQKIVFAVYLVSFILKAILPLTEQRDYVNLTLYVTRPDLWIFLPFFLIAFYLCTKKLRALGRCAEIFFIITLTGLTFIIVLAVPNFDAGALLPVGTEGIKPVLAGAYKAVPWFGDCVYLAVITGKAKKEKFITTKITLSYSVAGIGVLAFLLTFYGTFSAIAFRQRFALTEMSKYSAVINSIGRLDYLAIFMLLSSGVVAVVLPLYFAVRTAEKLFGIKQRWICPAAVTIIAMIPVLFLTEYYAGMERFLTTAGSALFIVTGNLFPIAVSVITLLKNRKKRKS